MEALRKTLNEISYWRDTQRLTGKISRNGEVGCFEEDKAFGVSLPVLGVYDTDSSDGVCIDAADSTLGGMGDKEGSAKPHRPVGASGSWPANLVFKEFKRD
jgi:hypothetical protein